MGGRDHEQKRDERFGKAQLTQMSDCLEPRGTHGRSAPKPTVLVGPLVYN